MASPSQPDPGREHRSLSIRAEHRRDIGVPDRRGEKTLTTTFADLGTLPEIVDALASHGITAPFPIQEMAVPIALTGSDLIAQARTGTGKTLAFGIPLLQRIASPRDRDYADVVTPGKPQALVVAPTRELALQVGTDLAKASSERGIRVVEVYGGVSYEQQIDPLRAGVDVVVGTPGRLLDLADRKDLDLSHVKILVLDEADRMLDLGFLPDVERLIAMTHETRQTMLFSATMPGDIVQLARRHMRHPINVRAESMDEGQVVPATAQFVYRAHDLDKPEVVARILQAEGRGRVIVFCTTKRQAQRVSDDLADRGFSAAAIHGDLGQAQRERALERFRKGTIDVLVATDVAARGIDVEGVTHVVNYTCPDDDKMYVHRIGRTGRAGASGVAVTFVDWPDTPRWKVINKALNLPFDEPVETYSTSDHLFTDLGIPRETIGRIGEAPASDESRERQGTRHRKDKRTRGGRGRGERSERPDRGDRGGERGSRSERGDRDRRPESDADGTSGGRGRRRRLRKGVPVEGGEDSARTPEPVASAPETTSLESASPESANAESGNVEPGNGAESERRGGRRRRRRRGGSGRTGEQVDSAASAEPAES